MNNDPNEPSGRELWLFTMRFPYGYGESFLESELTVLARGFERVILFPLFIEGIPRTVPANVDVVRLLSDDPYKAVGPLRMLTDLRRWNHILRVSKASAPSPGVWAARWREVMSRIRQAMHREQRLRERFGRCYDPHRVVLYSYWTSDWATVLGLWKLAEPEVRFSSRMMGFDMFDHRAQDNWQMLQAFHVQQVDRVFTISKAGQDHMLARFPAFRDKFLLSHLATMDHGLGPWAASHTLRIASCSNMIPLKRVHLIVEALHSLPLPVEWTHFGDGPERHRIQEMVYGLPQTIKVDLKGSRPNSEVIEWYRSNPVDVFVHMSETEGGAPVALQEAASFGIPLVATDAGGVKEVVTPNTGMLLPVDSTAHDLASKLLSLYNSSWRTTKARANVRAYWRSHFNAEQVHQKLLLELLRK